MPKNFVRIDGWPVAPAVARAYLPMKAAHDAETGLDLTINSGYRTYSEQAAIFEARYCQGCYSPWGDYRTYQGVTWGRTSGEGPVASPDVGSNHTRGFALDLNVYDGSESQRWMIANAPAYGFYWGEGESIGESWHWNWMVRGSFPDGSEPDPWEGRGAPDPVYASDPGMSLDGAPASGSGGGSTPNPSDEEDDMPKLYRIADDGSSWNGNHYAVAWGGIKQIASKESVMGYEDAHHTLGFAEIPVSEWAFRVIMGVNGIATVSGTSVLDSEGRVLDQRDPSNGYVRGGSWDRGDNAERLAYLAQK